MIESILAELSTEFPDLAEVDAAIQLTATAKSDLDTAQETLNSASAIINNYQREIRDVERAVVNAREISQLVERFPVEVEAVGERLGQILMEIEEINPSADVYVVGYYNALAYLPEEVQAQLTVPQIIGFNEVIESVTTEAGAVYVPTYDIFDGEHLTFLPNPQDIHPSEAGYQAIAEVFMSRISESYPEREIDSSETDGDDEGAIADSDSESVESATNLYTWVSIGILIVILCGAIFFILKKSQNASEENQ